MRTVQMQVLSTIVANTTTANVLDGQKFQFAPFDCMGAMYETGSATGLLSELSVGERAITDQLRVNANNRVPIEPDDLQIEAWEAEKGQPITLKVTNSTGGNLTHICKVVLAEIETEQGYE